MSTVNNDFIEVTGGTAFNKRGYDVRNIRDYDVPLNADFPEGGGWLVKSHTTIVDPKNPSYQKTVTEYCDGTIISRLDKWETEEPPFSRTRIKGRDGKWYLLEYKNGFFGWQNSELLERGKKTLSDIPEAEGLSDREKVKLLRKINAPIAPWRRVVLQYGIYPELTDEIKPYPPQIDIDFKYLNTFPERAERQIQKGGILNGLTKKEAKMLMDLYQKCIKEEAENTIEYGKKLIERGKSWLDAIQKVHV